MHEKPCCDWLTGFLLKPLNRKLYKYRTNLFVFWSMPRPMSWDKYSSELGLKVSQERLGLDNTIRLCYIKGLISELWLKVRHLKRFVIGRKRQG